MEFSPVRDACGTSKTGFSACLRELESRWAEVLIGGRMEFSTGKDACGTICDE